MPTRDRGFASLSKERRAEISRLGGIAAHVAGTAHEWTTREAQAAGLKGGKASWKKKKAALAALTVLLLWARPAHAQTATPANALAWDQAGQSAAIAQGASYKLYIDAAPAVTLTSVTCATSTATPPATTCQTTGFPAMTPGAHSLQLTQTLSGVESAKSAPIAITLVIVVVPSNVRIQ